VAPTASASHAAPNTPTAASKRNDSLIATVGTILMAPSSEVDVDTGVWNEVLDRIAKERLVRQIQAMAADFDAPRPPAANDPPPGPPPDAPVPTLAFTARDKRAAKDLVPLQLLYFESFSETMPPLITLTFLGHGKPEALTVQGPKAKAFADAYAAFDVRVLISAVLKADAAVGSGRRRLPKAPFPAEVAGIRFGMTPSQVSASCQAAGGALVPDGGLGDTVHCVRPKTLSLDGSLAAYFRDGAVSVARIEPFGQQRARQISDNCAGARKMLRERYGEPTVVLKPRWPDNCPVSVEEAWSWPSDAGTPSVIVVGCYGACTRRSQDDRILYRAARPIEVDDR
jgi:hypothetical protein